MATQIVPYIFYRDVRAALDWLTIAFGFVEDLCEETPSGGRHAEMTLDGQRIMMGQSTDRTRANPRDVGRATMGIFVWIADADAHFRRAKAAGADVLYPPADQPYGRGYAALDLDGHPWFFTTPTA